MGQTICIPSAANAGAPQSLCQRCNASSPYSHPSCCTSRSSKNSQSNIPSPTLYCAGGACNTICNTVQSYCANNTQLIANHPDVGPHPPIACVNKDEFIFRNWTAQYWNTLIDKLDMAERVGQTSSHGSSGTATKAVADPKNEPHFQDSLITAEKYNQVAKKLNYFGVSIGLVSKEEVIRGAHALALVDGYNTARFKGNVCDACNAGMQTVPECNCQCDCACDCNCGCDCPCPCNCSCPCSCNCSCNNSCGCNCTNK